MIISIPIIKRAIPIISPARRRPKRGDTIIDIDIVCAMTPTPMLKALDHSRLSLFIIPDTIFSIPTKSNAIATKIIARAAAHY